MAKRIIVSGAGGSAGTNFIQSLRLAPEKIYIVGTDSSKYYAKLSQADKTYVLPHCDHPNYLHDLNEIIKNEGIDFIHPQPDPEVKFISDNRSVILARTFLPDKRTIDIAQDKFLFNELMEEYQVPCPFTEQVIDENNLRLVFNYHGEKMWIRASRGAGSLAALPITDPDQAVMWIKYWKTKGLDWADFIISEFLPGKEYAFQSVWKDGELITSAARQRLEYLFQARMPSGQSSTPTIAKSVHNDKVNEVATKAVKALDKNATGVFCVDLKEDKDGVPNVMECNCGRFFTTSLFFSTAGSNMPYTYLCLGMGESIPEQKKYNAVPKDWVWVRQIDCQQQLVKEEDL